MLQPFFKPQSTTHLLFFLFMMKKMTFWIFYSILLIKFIHAVQLDVDLNEPLLHGEEDMWPIASRSNPSITNNPNTARESNVPPKQAKGPKVRTEEEKAKRVSMFIPHRVFQLSLTSLSFCLPESS